jgi:hypothetical protein
MNIEIDGEKIIVDGEKYVRENKQEESEIEDGRLVYVFDTYESGISGVKKGTLAIAYNKQYVDGWEFVKPVHRRWNELNQKERELAYYISRHIESARDMYEKIYKLITGEDHP